MARGARFKWTPTSSALCGPVAFAPDQAEKDILSYLLFATRQGVDPGAKLLLSYASSQEIAGMCPVAIANRVELLRRITWENAQGHIAQIRISRTCASLRKANAGGPKRKVLFSIEILMSFCSLCPDNTRDLHYQILWYVCCATGCRPEETTTMLYKWSGSLSVQWNGRKNAITSGARFYLFDAALSAPAPPHIAGWFAQGKPLPVFGKRHQIASNMNSWLAKFHGRHGIAPPGEHITSTCPRVRMNNKLRDLVDSGRLTVPVYEAMIGHTVKVSDQSYRW